ncbi:MAG: class I SAM-dependent methyltransferase [Bacteroidota bacterium]
MSNNSIKIFIFVFSLILLWSCTDSNGKSIFKPNRIDPPNIQYKEKSLYEENVGRHSWQKPELVIGKLGEVDGKTIADIGAGTGYFAMNLAIRNAKVIAIDIDTAMINFVDYLHELMPSAVQNNITTRLALPDDPLLKDEEVDMVIIINTISYIDNLDAYLKIVQKGIKPNGSIMILDYKNKIIDIDAPPLADRVSIGMLQTYLAAAGYTNIVVDDTSLDYQYIVTAEVE